MRRIALYLTALLLLAAPVLAAQQSAASGKLADTGDFRAGDRIMLTVDGEDKLTGTFTVLPGPALDLPEIGTVSLAGVRRTDLEAYLTTAIGRYIKDAHVRATSTVRIGVIGQVARPGFYDLPASSSITDVLMAAGGPAQSADVGKLKLTRVDTTAVPPDSLRAALAQNLTLAQLGVRSGDQLFMPAVNNSSRWAQILGLIVAVPALVFAIRAFK
ncbi:MAG: polysaccharide biosynthesis/export family protein [Gemmatimonadaceae bacterium]